MTQSEPDRAPRAVWRASERLSHGFASEAGTGAAYDEEAFRHFLAIERKRAERSNRSVLLLLVDVKPKAGMSPYIDPPLAGKLFSGLSRCLRETDFVGWYRAGRVVAAVLTQHSDVTTSDISSPILTRITEVLHSTVPSQLADSIQVRISRFPPTVKDRS